MASPRPPMISDALLRANKQGVEECSKKDSFMNQHQVNKGEFRGQEGVKKMANVYMQLLLRISSANVRGSFRGSDRKYSHLGRLISSAMASWLRAYESMHASPQRSVAIRLEIKCASDSELTIRT